MKTETSGVSANRLLAMLTRADFERLAADLKQVSLDQGTLLYEPGDEIENILFPHIGMISLLAVMKDGKAIETATVGREGVVGATAGLGLFPSMDRAVVQMPLIASQIGAVAFRKAIKSSITLRDLVICHNQVLLAQVQTTAACNALHAVEARMCRWILQTRDRSDSDTIPLTQEFLSEMLGVRRSSVSEVASKLQADGLVRYSRGVIEIVDRAKLEAASCECYALLVERTARLLPLAL